MPMWVSSKFHEPSKLLTGAVLRLRVPATASEFMEWKFDKKGNVYLSFRHSCIFNWTDAQMRFSHLEMRLFNLISHDDTHEIFYSLHSFCS